MGHKGGFFTGRLFWVYWFPLITYGLALFVQSAYPSPQSLPRFPYGDKVLHFFAYAVMGGLFFRALLVTWPRWRSARIVFYSVLFSTLYGVSDEIHQIFVASRTADQMDVLADFLGGAFGAICFCVVVGLLGRRDSRGKDQKSEV